MECPYCEQELHYHDTYGTGRHEYYYGTAANGIHYPSTWKKLGDIYKCENEECEAFEQHFYTDERDNLHEGYPC
jgi:hypothetical protein